MNLAGRVALVTGAARRLGAAIALRLATAGCHVAIHYRTSRDDAEATATQCARRGVRAGIFRADLASLDECASLVEQVRTRFGRLDVLINNASVFQAQSLDALNWNDWQHTLDVNLRAPLALVHAARAELALRGGRVLQLTDAAVDRPRPSHLAYCVSKAGLECLTRALARALAPHATVCAIAPGVAEWPEEMPQADRDRLTARIPLARAGTPDEVAGLVHYLLSEGDYLTGVTIPFDGGRQCV